MSRDAFIETGQIVYPPDFPTRADMLRAGLAGGIILLSQRFEGAKGLAMFGAGVVIGRPFVQKAMRFDEECDRYEQAGGTFAEIREGTAAPIRLS